MTTEIVISVIIPAWNASATIDETLDSIASQTCLPAEVIVVDDGSTDSTVDRVKAHHMAPRLISQKQGGAARAINVGWQAATGNWIACLDSDDLWTSNWLACAMQSLKDYASDMVMGNMTTFLDGNITADEAQGLLYQKHADKSYLPGSSIFSKEVLVALNGFDESFRTGYFIEFFDRFQRAGYSYQHIANEGLLRRIRKNSLSWPATKGKESYLQQSPLESDFLRIARLAILAKKQQR